MSTPPPRHTIGLLGCGNICSRYVQGMARYSELEIVRVADVDVARAEAAAAEHGIAAWGDDADLYGDDSVEIVVNLTPPVHHAATTIAALRAGKHVYTEKPLATTIDDGRAVIEVATETGRLLGSAPDTFLGSASQTVRQAVDHGMIGEPMGALAFIRHHRVETWHPDPRFLFQPGGGPVLDMGAYYLTILVNCLGPIATVAAADRVGAPRREVTSPNRLVDHVDVETPTHAAAVLTFRSGAIASALMSFEVWNTEAPRLEIYGSEGTLSLPNPNNFDGNVRLKQNRDEDWAVLAPAVELFGALDSPEQLRRGLGVHDLATAIGGGPHRATAELAFHVLEVLIDIDTAGPESRAMAISSTCERPPPRDEP